MENFILIYGKKPVEEFLNKHSELVKEVWIKEKTELLSESLKINSNIRINILCNEQIIYKLFNNEKVNHQGYVAKVKNYEYLPSHKLIEEVSSRNKDLILILDRIQDPHNFGAIIRSALLFGVKNIIIMSQRQVDVNGTVVKTSAGSVYDINITKVPNLNNIIRQLKKNDYWIYASNLDKNSSDIRTVNFSNKTVLIVGNEEKGVSQLLSRNSDLNICISTSKQLNSLNVSTATAIMLFEISNNINII